MNTSSKLCMSLLALPCVTAVACGPGAATALAPEGSVPKFVDDTDPQRARVTMVKETSRPYVVDWTNEGRGSLEIRSKHGPAIVHFDEHAMQLLPDCEAEGSYNFAGFSPKGEVRTLHSRAELYTNLPFSAVQLEGHLRQAGGLTIAIRSVGSHELDRPALKRSQLHGRCDGATHFVRRMTVGAFRFMAGAQQEAGAQVGVMGYGANAQGGGDASLYMYDGDFTACNAASVDSDRAPANCAAIIQVELVPLDLDDAGHQTPSCGEGLRWDGNGCVSVARVQQQAQQQQPQAQQPTGTAPAQPPPAPHGGFQCDPSNAPECVQQCKLGNLPSCVNLGRHLQAGTGGMPQDEQRALKLWDVACKGGVADGCSALNLYFNDRQDWNRALIYGSAGCLAGDAASCTNIAVQAYFGRGTAQNRPHAFKLWYRACKMREYQACSNAGVMILHGIDGAPQDPVAARRLFELACNSPSKRGCDNLATCYEQGLGGTKDFRQAVELYLRSCNETGNAVACTYAGLLIEENSQNAEHRAKALSLYEKGCSAQPNGGCFTTEEMKRYYPGAYSEEGYDRRACEDAEQSALACYNAGIGYERGYGGTPDRDRAKFFLDKACNEGKLRKACRAPRVGEPTRI
jgi:uncharacterized protein